MKNEPQIYKFTFYGCVHPWATDEEKKDLAGEVEEVLCHVHGLQQITKLEASDMELREKPKAKRKTPKKG